MNSLIWYSQIGPTGTGSFCVNQCKSLHKLNYFDDIHISPDPKIDRHPDPIINDMIARGRTINVRESILLQVMWPEKWFYSVAARPKYYIGYNAIEGTKIPYNWVTTMNDDDIDLVITMSYPMKNMFVENGVNPKKLFPLGHGFNPDIFYPTESPRSKDKPYTFLYLNGWRTSIGRNDRKGPEILLDAWVKGKFLNNPKYHLYMKVNMVYEKPRDYFADIKKHLGYDLSKWKNFTWDITNYHERELGDVYRNADCFVMPSKGEGFGITAMEAKACGLPIIIPRNRYSGYMDFCNDNDTFFIKIDREEEVDSRLMGHLYSGSTWHIPSTEDLIEQMHWCANYPKEAKKKGTRASKFVHKDWTWDDASIRFIKELKKRGMYK